MKPFRITGRRVATLLAVIALSGAMSSAGAAPREPAAPAAVTPLAGNSIYQLRTPLTDQAGHDFSLADKRGTPMIVSMFDTVEVLR